MEIIGFLFILDFNELKVTVITYNTKKTIALTNVVYFELYDKTAYEPKRNHRTSYLNDVIMAAIGNLTEFVKYSSLIGEGVIGNK
jgi:hypothetical protein